MNTTYAKRVLTPKSDIVAIYIGFIGSTLYLFECNAKNQTVRQFELSLKDDTIPDDHLAKAIANKGMAFNQVKVYSHPDYIEYFKRGSAGTKSIKQDFWVRTTARNPNMKRVA
tara:strand:- start:15028 stop:15366 length:339 start_codon:yes stop_codon:yes gene_type:complete